MFEKIISAPDDPILGLSEEFLKDPRAHKINLGVGIYKTEAGETPVLDTVKKAEKLLLESEKTKSYLSIEGNKAYNLAVQKLIFGDESKLIAEQRIQTIQTPGGTGALYLGAEFIARQLGAVTVWLSNPTWVNHKGIFTSAGLETQFYDYYDADAKSMNFAAMLSSLQQAKAGDVVLFHGCCHNPTGIDPNLEQWRELAKLCHEKELLPFFDFAYQGFAKGLHEDSKGMLIFTEYCPEMLVANSFSKNLGLYKERVGALSLIAKDTTDALNAFSQAKAIARVTYSNPPSHGAAVVTEILSNAKLYQEWQQEVGEMRKRIQAMRSLFVQALKEVGVKQDFSFIEDQCGMFSFSGLTKAQVGRLKDEFAVYIVDSGRINVAGITEQNINALCQAIAQVLE